MAKRSSRLLNTAVAIVIPASLAWAFLTSSPSASNREIDNVSSQKQLVKGKKRPRTEDTQLPDYAPSTESRASLAEKEASKEGPAFGPADAANISEELKPTDPAGPPSENIQGFNSAASPPSEVNRSDELEAELGPEKAQFYREQEALAFRTFDDEQTKEELDLVSDQMELNPQQLQASELIFEEAQTALSQQQMTVRSQIPKMKTLERLDAYTRLAQFRQQFIYDRLKSVLNPPQLAAYKESFAPLTAASELSQK